MKKKHALVLGATGATGQELVKFLLQDLWADQRRIHQRQRSWDTI